MSKLINRSGHRYGRLSVLKDSGERKEGQVLWRCICDCGNKTTVRSSNLANGVTKSCGCFSRESSSKRMKTHDMTNSPEFIIWGSMIARCTNPKHKSFKRYGERGITVCDEWHKFENFYKDMGNRPKKGLTLDRIDNEKDYSKENCKWSTTKEQNRNRHNSVSFNGECTAVAAQRLGCSTSAIIKRLKRGWTIEKAFTTPVVKRLSNNK